MKQPVYWVSPPPEKCQGCENDIEEVFYDGRTRIGPWALMCPMCFYLGPGIGQTGTGFGQKYEKQRDGRWLKTEG